MVAAFGGFTGWVLMTYGMQAEASGWTDACTSRLSRVCLLALMLSVGSMAVLLCIPQSPASFTQYGVFAALFIVHILLLGVALRKGLHPHPNDDGSLFG